MNPSSLCYARRMDDTDDVDALLRPGERVGPYVIVASIGPNEWTPAYLADRDGGRVTLHIVPCTGRDVTADLARFVAEIGGVVAALQGLAHPAIRAVHAVGTHGPLKWLAAAPDDGIPLLEWSRTRPWTAVLAALRALGSALAAVETIGLPGDAIRPDDIRVGPNDQVRVDVAHALARAQPRIDGDPMLGAGEALYMSPEAHLGAPRSQRSTQHLLSLIAWEALYGRLPFDRSSIVKYVLAVLDGRALDPPSDTEVPDTIHQALVRGLAADPSARWPSIDALLTALTPRDDTECWPHPRTCDTP